MGGGAGVSKQKKPIANDLRIVADLAFVGNNLMDARSTEILYACALRMEALEAALERIRDTPHVVYEPVRQIAREALK
jgi:hypothetical protein